MKSSVLFVFDLENVSFVRNVYVYLVLLEPRRNSPFFFFFYILKELILKTTLSPTRRMAREILSIANEYRKRRYNKFDFSTFIDYRFSNDCIIV